LSFVGEYLPLLYHLLNATVLLTTTEKVQKALLLKLYV